MRGKFVVWFSEVGKDDISLVGGKGANLGEMVSFGVPVPPGFIVTSGAYFDFLRENNLTDKIKKELQKLDENNPQSYSVVSARIKEALLAKRVPKDTGTEIIRAYLDLGGILGQRVLVAVRSSATAEDLPTASFAGQQVTFLNVSGEANVVEKVKECWASLFEPRAIFYRQERNFDHLKVGIAVPVQKMIQSETSGVMFTCDPVTGAKNRIVIEAIYGLGELIVQGEVAPDNYEIGSKSLKVLTKKISSQPVQLIKLNGQTSLRPVQSNKQSRQKITDSQIMELAKLGNRIYHHYFFPQDIEWAIERGKIYILQTRPVTTLEQAKKTEEKRTQSFTKDLTVLLRGMPASPGVATGVARIIHSAKEINKVRSGEVLVAPMTSPDYVPAMKKVVGIVTDSGGQTSHAAIVSRELGIPCVVGTKEATKTLKNSQIITVNGTKGEILKGGFRSAENLKVSSSSFLRTPSRVSLNTATKIYVNLAEPEIAAEVAKRDADGVGLLRAEFMIAQMGLHPKKIIREKKEKLFIKHLSDNLAIFCESFKPRPVVYRATDFKTNEYRNLSGGREFEPEEPNPMLGFRGAARYIRDAEVFELELAAIKEVRAKKGLKNLWLMIPFVRSPQELHEVKKIIVSSGLMRSSTFKLWMMVEIPTNVIMLEDFLEIGIDGVSIGSNDLTMLILGVDRDNNEVAPSFNEEDPAVLWALERVIKTCHKYSVTSSICGQAASSRPALVEKLVEWGITSVSVNPDAIEACRGLVHQAEEKLILKK